MAKICVLTAEGHAGHPIIRRQIPTLVEAGHAVSVLDPSNQELDDEGIEYEHVQVRMVNLYLIGKVVWFLLRRAGAGSLDEAWWTIVYFLQMILTALAYVGTAFRGEWDYYQVHDFDTLLAGLILGKLRRRPVIYDAHELRSEQGDPASMANRVIRALEKRLIPHVDQLIVPNEARARVYASRCNLRKQPTVVLNCPPSTRISQTNLIRERLDLPMTTRVVLYHGTLMPGRALEELIQSARDFDDGIALVIIGGQNDFFGSTLKPLWQREELADRVFFLPYVPPSEIARYVASADLGAVIYKNINLNNYLCAPTKLYEYFMAGVPVVACNFPEMVALLKEYPVGETFDPDVPASISAAVNRFLASYDERRLEIQRCLEAARKRFNWETEGQRLLEAFGTPECTNGDRHKRRFPARV